MALKFHEVALMVFNVNHFIPKSIMHWHGKSYVIACSTAINAMSLGSLFPFYGLKWLGFTVRVEYSNTWSKFPTRAFEALTSPVWALWSDIFRGFSSNSSLFNSSERSTELTVCKLLKFQIIYELNRTLCIQSIWWILLDLDLEVSTPLNI